MNSPLTATIFPPVVVIPRRQSSVTVTELPRRTSVLATPPSNAKLTPPRPSLMPLRRASDTDESDNGPPTPTTPCMMVGPLAPIQCLELASPSTLSLSKPTTPSVTPFFNPFDKLTPMSPLPSSTTTATPAMPPSPIRVPIPLDPLSALAASYPISMATPCDMSRSHSDTSSIFLPLPLSAASLTDVAYIAPSDTLTDVPIDAIAHDIDAPVLTSPPVYTENDDDNDSDAPLPESESTATTYQSVEQKNAAKNAVLAALSDVVQVQPDPAQGAAPHSRHGSSPLNPAPAVPYKDGNGAVAPSAQLVDVGAGPSVPNKVSFGGRFANAFKKQTPGEKETKRRAKQERMREEINKSSAKNSRMDVIDRLDASAINGFSMFHHDSPYDAVSAHRNVNKKRAPVGAFDPNVDPITGLPINRGANAQPGSSQQPSQASASSRSGNGASRGGLSPLAQATLARMDSAEQRDDKKLAGSGPGEFEANVPALGMYDGQEQPVATPVEHDQQGYWTQPAHMPTSRHDASVPNADVWGVSAEPWQDFASPKTRGGGGGSDAAGLSPHVGGSGSAAAAHAGRYSLDNRSGIASSASSVLDMEAIMTGRTNQDSNGNGKANPNPEVGGSASPFPERDWGDANGPKRNRSIIKRIRSVRREWHPDVICNLGRLTDSRYFLPLQNRPTCPCSTTRHPTAAAHVVTDHRTTSTHPALLR